MSGKFEKEMKTERQIKNRLENAPAILSEYYYSMMGSGKSYETSYRYLNYILSFISFTFKDRCDEEFYKHIKPSHINKYMASLRTKEVNGKSERTSDSYREVQWVALHSFFKFLVPDYLDINPVASTQKPKNKDNPKVTFLTTEEISKVLNNVHVSAPERFVNRDLCVLKLGFSTGLRVSAIIQIDIDDIDFQRNQIRVIEKGDYDHYVFIGENLKKQIMLWLEDRQKYFPNCNTNALFISQRKQRMSDDTVGEMLSKYSVGATDKHVTPHVMRHSCATNLYEATGDIYLCAKQLNHASVSTTQIYAELSKEKQKMAASLLDGMI